MSKINRKTIVVTSLVVLLVITSYINYQFNQPDDQSASLPQATPSAVTSTDTAQGEGDEDTQEAAAQAVGTIVHGADGVDDSGAVLACAVLMEDAGDRAAGGDADLPFFL